jgi:hypothetical protein
MGWLLHYFAQGMAILDEISHWVKLGVMYDLLAALTPVPGIMVAAAEIEKMMVYAHHW